MNTPHSTSILAVFVTLLAVPGAAPAQPAPPPGVPGLPARTAETERRAPVPPGIPTTPENVHLPTEGEVKLGRDTAAEVEKRYKVVLQGAEHERLQRVARDVVRAIERQEIIAEYRRIYNLPRSGDRARRVPFEYSFKVVDDKKVINAFSLAGGPIYVTRGLLDYARSDDELAAVLAHECAHVAFHHVEQLVRKQNKMKSAQIWAMLATIIAGAAGGGEAAIAAGNLFTGAQLVSIATLTGYGRELEHEADRIAVRALASTDYHPAAMLTFMRKLARDDRLRGNPDAGIFQSHPYSNERVEQIRKEVLAQGYQIDPGIERKVSRAFHVETASRESNGRPATELRLNGSPLFTVVAGEGGLSAAARAKKIAEQVEHLFTEGLTFDDVKQSQDRSALLLKGIPVIRVYPDDARELGSPAAVTEKAYKAIMRALWKEKLETQF